MRTIKQSTIFIIAILFLSACGKYTPSAHDVVNSHGDIKNLEILDNFIEDMAHSNAANVKVIDYTDEGDPIIHELRIVDGELFSIIDTRHDDFGEQYIEETKCESIIVTNEGEQKIYQLVGCENEERHHTILIQNK
ncbi:DUF4362 domain-containing protein [Sutcliffiella rhizosphaerae]|uniref:DUF4362 domain-containing protein n=1 Tax=Sutcliffiella rhizosphaerae TaxID=2880967 RepID=A0ABM8YK95_9BACI|nr:DUF4362 domain-containing protein [Sutcliffiella rhizosphaerae]CAG9620350.1 hypothetical protein BACCIP111883_01118 [Sutcliffiella rhizosphaerae]